MFDGDITSNRHGGNPESIEAYNASHPRHGRDRQRIVDLLADRGGEGATCEEVAQALGMPYTTASARLSELKFAGFVMRSGEKRLTSHNASAAVIVLP